MAEHGFSSYLRYLHGAYNFTILLFFFYHAWSGLMIRKARRNGRPPSVKFIRRHRKFGFFLALLGIFGFLGGGLVVYLHEGRFFDHPLHFVNGLTISVLICFAFFVSKKIKAQTEQWRDPHFIIGLLLLFLYCIQAFLGIKMLL